ncbi:MAG: hypothetical protein GDA53_04940 [Rhodobacteraceae bacterium]|nr:hypothetical protein [Paracoccaceae bacterium]
MAEASRPVITRGTTCLSLPDGRNTYVMSRAGIVTLRRLNCSPLNIRRV